MFSLRKGNEEESSCNRSSVSSDVTETATDCSSSTTEMDTKKSLYSDSSASRESYHPCPSYQSDQSYHFKSDTISKQQYPLNSKQRIYNNDDRKRNVISKDNNWKTEKQFKAKMQDSNSERKKLCPERNSSKKTNHKGKTPKLKQTNPISKNKRISLTSCSCSSKSSVLLNKTNELEATQTKDAIHSRRAPSSLTSTSLKCLSKALETSSCPNMKDHSEHVEADVKKKKKNIDGTSTESGESCSTASTDTIVAWGTYGVASSKDREDTVGSCCSCDSLYMKNDRGTSMVKKADESQVHSTSKNFSYKKPKESENRRISHVKPNWSHSGKAGFKDGIFPSSLNIKGIQNGRESLNYKSCSSAKHSPIRSHFPCDKGSHNNKGSSSNKSSQIGLDSPNDKGILNGKDSPNAKDIRNRKDGPNGKDIRNAKDTLNDRNMLNGKIVPSGKDSSNRQDCAKDKYSANCIGSLCNKSSSDVSGGSGVKSCTRLKGIPNGKGSLHSGLKCSAPPGTMERIPSCPESATGADFMSCGDARFRFQGWTFMRFLNYVLLFLISVLFLLYATDHVFHRTKPKDDRNTGYFFN